MTPAVRRCDWCGDALDPVHYCVRCRSGAACDKHNRPMKRKDARFCNTICKAEFFRDVAWARKDREREVGR